MEDKINKDFNTATPIDLGGQTTVGSGDNTVIKPIDPNDPVYPVHPTDPVYPVDPIFPIDPIPVPDDTITGSIVTTSACSMRFGNNIVSSLRFGNSTVDAAYFGDTKIYPNSYKKKIVSIVGNNIIVFEDDLSFNVYSCPHGDMVCGIVSGNYVYMYDKLGCIYRTADFINWKQFNPSMPVTTPSGAMIRSNGSNLLLIYAGSGNPCIFDIDTNTKTLIDNSITGSSCRIRYFEFNEYFGHFIGYKYKGTFREYNNYGDVVGDHVITSSNPCGSVNTFGRFGSSKFIFEDAIVYDIAQKKAVFTASSYIGPVRGTNRRLATIVNDGTYTGIVEFSDDYTSYKYIYMRNIRYPMYQVACIDDTYIDCPFPQVPPSESELFVAQFRKSLLGTDAYTNIFVRLDKPTTYQAWHTIDVMNVNQ